MGQNSLVLREILNLQVPISKRKHAKLAKQNLENEREILKNMSHEKQVSAFAGVTALNSWAGSTGPSETKGATDTKQNRESFVKSN